MSKLDQKIKEINIQILKLAKTKSALLAIKASACSGTKGGEGSGRYPSGSAGAESIPKTPPATNPVTAKSDNVRGGMSSTSHDIIDSVVSKDFAGGQFEEVVQVEVENLTTEGSNSTKLDVTVIAEVRPASDQGDPPEREGCRIEKVTDPDGNEVAVSPAMIATMEANIDRSIKNHDQRDRD